MKYNNNHSGNNNSADRKSNSNNNPDCGMNEIDTETPVVWPSWCYAGNIVILSLFFSLSPLILF